MSTRRSRTGAASVALLLVAIAFPGSVLAAAPVAVDDPGLACADGRAFGGAFPIPEDWSGGLPGFERWLALLGPCGVLANDSDPDGDPLTWSIVGSTVHGDLLKLDETGFAYAPDPDYSTIAGNEPGGSWISDSFTYRATDGTTDSNLATMRFWVAPINDPPTFVPGPDVTATTTQPYSAPWASAVTAGPANEAAQHVSFDLSVELYGQTGLFDAGPAIAPDGTLTFTPGGTAGTATVTVKAVDDGGLEDYGLPASDMDAPDDTSDAVTFDITVPEADHPPVAVRDRFTVAEDAPPTFLDVLDNDVGDATLEVVDTTDGRAGNVAVDGTGLGVTFQPKRDHTGPAFFTYTIADLTGRRSLGTVVVDVTPVNDAPAPDADRVTVVAGTSVVVPVLVGDRDADGDRLTIVGATQGATGVVTLDRGTGHLSYRAAPGRRGTDTFTYTVSDGILTATATVRVTITASPLLPAGRLRIGGGSLAAATLPAP